jgi:tetratricopeptide (TPR) repeat protein
MLALYAAMPSALSAVVSRRFWLAFLAACFVLLGSSSAFAQGKYIKLGDKAFKKKDYYTAMLNYDLAIKNKDHERAKGLKQATFFYRYAECCRITYLFAKAEEYYSKCANHAEKAAFADVDFYFAYTLKHNGKYAAAKEAFESFLTNNASGTNPKVMKLIPKAEQEVKACVLAQQWVATPDDSVKIRALGKNINTQYSDFAPVEYENELFFSSLRFERQFQGRRDPNAPKEKFLVGKIFSSKEKGLRSATAISSLNVRYESTGNATFSPDGKYIFFTHCVENKEGVVVCQMRVAKRKGRSWEKPKNLPAPINIDKFTTTHPSIGFDSTSQELTLFFVSNRVGGSGEMDIWRAKIIDIEQLQFGEPQNLGTVINTPEADATPFFHTPTQTLFFASKWHEGLGGFDLFKSKRIASGWAAPTNLGVPYNSAANDIYLWIHPSDTAGYFSSNRTGSQTLTGESCCNDIYALSLPKRLTQAPPVWLTPKVDTPIVVKIDTPIVVKIDTPIVVKIDTPIVVKIDTPIVVKIDTPIVVKIDTPVVVKIDTPVVVQGNPVIEREQKMVEINDLLPLSLYFHNDAPDSNTTRTTTKLTYEQSFAAYLALKPDYLNIYSNGFKGVEAQAAARRRMEQFFDEQVEGEYERLNQCLDGILEALDMGIPLQIQVRGMASPRGNSNYNKSLAKRRISSINNYMLSYRNGAIKEYINKKQLIVIELPMGSLAESTATGELGDKQSIYGLEAAKDRRIEILFVKDGLK